jgi:hypothetical protein
VPAERVNDDRLYRALDRLLPHKEALEAHLKRRLGVLFALDYELLLYDVTSTYFEGQAERNPLARRGYSRDHRPDCKQVCIGLVVTREGLPLGYEVFAGNRTDVTTVAEIVGMMERRYGRAQRVWVMDRGMTSAENIAWLQSTERPYLIGASKSELKKLAPQLAEARDWRPVRDGVEAKVCAGPEGREIFLLVRSSERQQKEQAMHARFCARIETGLASLHARLAGRASQSIAAPQSVRLVACSAAMRGPPPAMTSVWSRTRPGPPGCASTGRCGPNGTTGPATAKAATGCAPICATGPPTRCGGPTVADLYPAHRGGSGVPHPQERPLNPSRLASAPGRVLAHLLVCFLAYVLWKTLEQWQSRAGLGNSPRTILQELTAIQSVDVVLPTAAVPPRELRLRCVVRPDRAQAILLERLGLRLPEWLRMPAAAPPM